MEFFSISKFLIFMLGLIFGLILPSPLQTKVKNRLQERVNNLEYKLRNKNRDK